MALVENSLLERLLRSLLGLAAMCVVFSSSVKADDDAPELDFLAYLGSWQESDEEWLAVAEWEGENQMTEDAQVETRRKDDENES
ncbi:MAG: hypothetical protein O6765_00830 [Gammaproteobacteria bacterium]|nr:hypothetical protein [Gammaproteobacteria bacterium]